MLKNLQKVQLVSNAKKHLRYMCNVNKGKIFFYLTSISINLSNLLNYLHSFNLIFKSQMNSRLLNPFILRLDYGFWKFLLSALTCFPAFTLRIPVWFTSSTCITGERFYLKYKEKSREQRRVGVLFLVFFSYFITLIIRCIGPVSVLFSTFDFYFIFSFWNPEGLEE